MRCVAGAAEEELRRAYEDTGVTAIEEPTDRLTPGAEVHHLRLPVRGLVDDGDGRLSLALQSSVWSPAATGAGEDRRLLGLLVSRVALLPLGERDPLSGNAVLSGVAVSLTAA